MPKIPSNVPQSTTPISKKDVDKEVNKLISIEAKRQLAKAESIIANIESSKKLLEDTQQDISSNTKELDKIKKEKEDIQGEVTLSLDKVRKLNEDIVALSKEKEVNEDIVNKLETKAYNFDEHISGLSIKITNLNSKIGELDNLIVKREKEVVSLDESIKSKKEELKNVDNDIASRKRKSADDLAVTKAHLEENKNTILVVKGEIAEISQELDELKEAKEILNSEVSALEDKRFKLSIQLEDYKKTIDDEYQLKFNQLEERKNVIDDREFRTNLISEGLNDRKKYLDAYKDKLLKAIKELLVEDDLSPKIKVVLQDLNDKIK